jgi:predicted nucleic acid-binding protein
VIDSSFWINSVRSGVARYLADYFTLMAPPHVVAELTALLGQPSPPEAAVAFRDWQQRGLIQTVVPPETGDRFHVGENEAIALAQEWRCVLLIDNSAPRDWSRGPLGLRVVDSPAFAVFLYDKGRLSYQQATTALAQSLAAHHVVREALILLARIARRRAGR